MAHTIAQPTANPLRELPENATGAHAKADLRKAEHDTDRYRRSIGRVISRARQLRGWTLDELASHCPPPEGSEKRDPRQVARWEAGKERPQFDVLIAVESFRLPLLIAAAERAGSGVAITTQIAIPRSA